jgi:hypothetical protein
MIAEQIVEVRNAHKDWIHLAVFPISLSDSWTFYNEAYFCACCGEVWARRRWPGRTCSWWVAVRPHTKSPFDWYDFDHFLHLPPETQETLANEFLDDPRRLGYTFASGPAAPPA